MLTLSLGWVCTGAATVAGQSPAIYINPQVIVHNPLFCLKCSDGSCSPNAEEAMGLLSIPLPVTRVKIEGAAANFLDYGVDESGEGSVIIRSGALGAYVVSRTTRGRWVEAFWGPNDPHHVVDVTGTPKS